MSSIGRRNKREAADSVPAPRPVYGADLVLWAEDQANALRNAAHITPELAIDWDNVADEIEALSRSERRKLASYTRTLLEHLIKLQVSPAREPRAGWRDTIRRTRLEIRDILEDSPSLIGQFDDIVLREMPHAQGLVRSMLEDYGEKPLISPGHIMYTSDEVLSGYWFPDPPN